MAVLAGTSHDVRPASIFLLANVSNVANRELSAAIENMNYHVTYEHSLKSAPDDFIVHVPCQLVDNVPDDIPRALLPEFITKLILSRSPQIGKIRDLRLL